MGLSRITSWEEKGLDLSRKLGRGRGGAWEAGNGPASHWFEVEPEVQARKKPGVGREVLGGEGSLLFLASKSGGRRKGQMM